MRGLLAAPLCILIALAYAWLDGDQGIRTWLALRADVARAEARIAALREEVAELEAEIAAFGESPFALERAIREELDWVRPGEVLVRMPSANGPAGIGLTEEEDAPTR